MNNRNKYRNKQIKYKNKTTGIGKQKFFISIEVVVIIYLLLPFITTTASQNNNNEVSEHYSQEYEEYTLMSTEDVDTSLKGKVSNLFSLSYIDELKNNIPIPNKTNLNDVAGIFSKNYIVDSRTGVDLNLFDFNKFNSADLKLKNDSGAKVLIFHTHSQETYSDSKGVHEGVIGLGNALEKELEEKYGIEVIHNTQSFDIVNGQVNRTGSYERMSPVIKNILENNPSIELVIDLHRDGVPDDVKKVATVNGKPTAKVMLVNGLCSRNVNGVATPIKDLVNPYIEENLALGYQLKSTADELYPNLFTKTYLHAYRYSLYMRPKSALVEIGAQTNTYQEALNAIEPLAKTIATVVK